MTRDEMIARIDEYLMKEFCEGHPKDANGAWDSWQSAANILQIVEAAGMLPPIRNADQKSSYGYARIYEWETAKTVERLISTCSVHGETEYLMNKNRDAFCEKCLGSGFSVKGGEPGKPVL